MNITIKGLGVNQTGGHDKIWGYFVTEQSTYMFWGRRNRKLRFKQAFEQAEAVDKFLEKIDKKGYKDRSNCWSKYVDDLEDQIAEYFTMDVMMDKVL